jgi:hypothetical protein
LVALELLCAHGGIYVDHGMQPLRSMAPLLSYCAFVGWEDEACVSDAVMGCPPGHPAFVQLLDTTCAAVVDGRKQDDLSAAVMTELFVGRDDVMVFPPDVFYPYRRSELTRERENFTRTSPWAFSVRHWRLSE